MRNPAIDPVSSWSYNPLAQSSLGEGRLLVKAIMDCIAVKAPSNVSRRDQYLGSHWFPGTNGLSLANQTKLGTLISRRAKFAYIK